MTNKSGFTLLEIAISLIIISIIAGSSFAIFNRLTMQDKGDITQERLGRIEEALMTFRRTHNRLPCPADASLKPEDAYYGIEAANPDLNKGTCTGATPAATSSAADHATKTDPLTGLPIKTRVAGGMVPVVTLGLSKKYALDGYDRKISYHIDAQATELSAFGYYTATHAGCFDLIIDDQKTFAQGDNNTITSHAVYALISHGANGHGAYALSGTRLNAGSTNSYQNNNAFYDQNGASLPYINLLFQLKPSTDFTNPKNAYDDIVRFKTRSDLRDPTDSPAMLFPDLAVWSAASSGEKGINFYWRCKSRFVMEDKNAADVAGITFYNYRFSPNNEFMLAGAEGTGAKHFTLWTYDGFMTETLPENSISPRSSGNARNVTWANDADFFIVSALEGTDNVTAGCNGNTGCNRVRVYERTGPRQFVSKDKAVEDILIDQINTASYIASGQSGTVTNRKILSAGSLNHQLSPDNNQLLLFNDQNAASRIALYKRMPDNTFKYVTNAFDQSPPIISTNPPVWTKDMRYLFVPGQSTGVKGWNEVQMYRYDGNFHYSKIANPITPSPFATYGAPLTSANGSAYAAAFSSNGRFLATAQAAPGGFFRIYELKNGDSWERLPLANIVTLDGSIINLSTKNIVGSGGGALVEKVEFSPDGRYLSVGMGNQGSPLKKLLIFQIEGNVFTLLEGESGPIPDVRSLPGNRSITSITWRNSMPWESQNR